MNAARAWLEKLGADMLRRSLEHMELAFFAMLAACALAVPLGIFLARCPWRKVVSIVMGVVNVIQPIPSLALIAFVVALFNLVHLPTIGMAPGLVALVAYALLPVLRNTYTGIRQVDPAVREVAVGMGMTPRQVLFSVELPLALPVIMAGVRIATVWTSAWQPSSRWWGRAVWATLSSKACAAITWTSSWPAPCPPR